MRVLVVEDEALLSQQLSDALGHAGYAVDCAREGDRADFLAQTERYDVVVLDLGLPRVDGLTARDSWYEKVQGIDAGADDYLAKPFRLEELMARVRGLIRRASQLASSEMQCGAVRMDTLAGNVTRDGQPVRLTALEFRVLSYLMHNRGRVVSQAELTDHIYAVNSDRDSNTIEVFVARLRRKLGAALIETVRGLGYRLGTAEPPR
jgi:two-component system OmpR family response regulator